MNPASRARTVQANLRASKDELARWKAAAAVLGVPWGRFVRDAAEERSRRVLACGHPVHLRRSWPGGQVCVGCGAVPDAQRAGSLPGPPAHVPWPPPQWPMSSISPNTDCASQ